ncbi:hypothetical protein SAMN04488008_1166 [Maribacter orientalis]|uniref:Uracil DNA glycosylase superfamily protein n=1 Tax=Maribacter orientalis TaxID=228957 RepID=A0A1H7XFK4_9FLAO|nr:hypothetical protein [Maribacter orientalis]SEM31988.1 hypothetical protein SAMN04488008_1166 [Maribacter orientalis]
MEEIIKEHISKEYEGQEHILDGIVSTQHYELAKPKILWILKEPHSGNESWDVRKRIQTLRENDRIAIGFDKTFTRIVYTTNAILNNIPWSEGRIRTNPEMIDELQKMAYINVKKTGGASKTKPITLEQAYNKSKDILFKQIELIKPDVLIFGGTFYLFEKDLGLPKLNIYGSGTCHAQSKNGQIFLNVYHPQKPVITKDYVDDIMLAVKNERKLDGKF